MAYPRLGETLCKLSEMPQPKRGILYGLIVDGKIPSMCSAIELPILTRKKGKFGASCITMADSSVCLTCVIGEPLPSDAIPVV